MAKKTAAAPISVRPDALKGKSVIITGEIDGQTRKSAEQILINAGATIEKSLNKKVQLVVLGADAGPKKLEKIESLGLETQEWDELIEEIKGEGGEEPAGDDNDDEDMDDAEEEEVEEKPKPQKGKAKANTTAKAKPAPKAKAAPKAPAKAKPSASSSDSPIAGKKVIITGTIAGHDRKSANAIVEEAGAEVAKSLNKQVELVILGANAGPDKLQKVEDLGIETIKWADLAEQLGIEAAPEKEVANVETGDAPDSIEGMTLLITGTIEGQSRSAAQKLLEGAGATFAKSLNKSVELVVLGSSPGPDKLNKIAELSFITCSFEDLVEKLGLEVSDEPPKKKAKKN